MRISMLHFAFVGLIAATAHAGPVATIEDHQLYQTDFTLIDGAAPPGWQAAAGTWSVQGGQYVQSATSGITRSWYDVGPQSMLSIQSVVRLTAGTAVRLYWNRADVGTDYVEWDGSQSRLRIVENGQVLRDIEFFLYLEQPFELRVEVRAGRLYAYVNHQHWLDVATAAVLDGRIGLGTRNAAAGFDDVLVMDALFHDERPILRLPYEAGQALIVGNAYKPGHTGIDFGWTTGDENFNGPMLAAADGVVTYVEFTNQSIIKIDHGGGYEGWYVHANPIYVTEGQQVSQGEEIGRIARWATFWDHVHFALLRRGESIRPEPMGGYRTFCEYSLCGAWYTSQNMPGLSKRVGIVARPNHIGTEGPVAWRDDFTGWVIDQKGPPPIWSSLSTQQSENNNAFLSVHEENGWLIIPGHTSTRRWIRTLETYTTATIRARARFDNGAPVGGQIQASLELRFRESDSGQWQAHDGLGYALVLDAHNNVVQLRHANGTGPIDGYLVNHPINAGTEYYLWVDLDDARTNNIHIRVGTTENSGNIADWQINNRLYASGVIGLANRHATQIAWDWIEVEGYAYDPDAPIPPPVHYIGDFDDDGDVDLDDLAHLQTCLDAPGTPINDPGCLTADLNTDGSVDQADFILFLGCVSGAGVPPEPQCLQ